MKIPNAESAFVDIVKLRDYSLSPEHEEGKHKARVFAVALGLTVDHAEWLREKLLAAAKPRIAGSEEKRSLGRGIWLILSLPANRNQRDSAVFGSSEETRISLDW